MKFHFEEVTHNDMLDKVFRFRYRIWCIDSTILDARSYPDGREVDDYDDYADHFAVFDANGDICATVRLIHHSPIGYPTENYLPFDRQRYAFDRKRLGELSRIFLDPKYRNMRDTKAIMQGLIHHQIYKKLQRHDIAHCYGALETGFQKLLSIFKIPYIFLGEGAMYYGGTRYPCIMHTSELEKQNPALPGKYEGKT